MTPRGECELARQGVDAGVDAPAGSVAAAAAAAARPAAAVGTTPGGAGRTAVLTVAATPAQVFRELADIENLPRWASGFCERVELARGRWLGLTSLGEMYLALEADERAGTITWSAGWREGEMHAVQCCVSAVGPDVAAVGTRVTFSARSVVDEGHARWCRALADEWPGLVAWLGGGVRGEAGS